MTHKLSLFNPCQKQEGSEPLVHSI
uniref:Uncharacterized protein n=1 Tax=Rhizophora mucronata TaxID=61149 RepID=A0A2P2PBH1_RHIMU